MAGSGAQEAAAEIERLRTALIDTEYKTRHSRQLAAMTYNDIAKNALNPQEAEP